MKKIKVLLLFLISFNVMSAQDSSWTIVKTKIEGWYKNKVNFFWADPSLEVKLGKLIPGAKVYPIEQREDVYHVKFQDGQIGWIYFTNLKETSKLVINHPTELCEIKGCTPYESGKPIDSLRVGDIVTGFGLSKEGAWHYVIDKKGRKGAVIRQYADTYIEESIPYYNEETERIFYFKDQLENKILNQNSSVLTSVLGEPGALVFNTNEDIYYFTNLEIYFNKLRYEGLKFYVQDGIVKNDSLIGAGESFFIDGFPLFIQIKAMDELSAISEKLDPPLFHNVGDHNIFIGILIRLLQVITIILFFSLAHFAASFLTAIIARIKYLGNLLVEIIGVLLSITLNYIYYIFLVAHIEKDSWFLIGIVMLFITFLSVTRILTKIKYDRCPECHKMNTAVDKGTVEAGKTHITEKKSQVVHTGQSKDGNRTINYYTKKIWDENTTEKDMKDYRKCSYCGYFWYVTYKETVSGHV